MRTVGWATLAALTMLGMAQGASAAGNAAEYGVPPGRSSTECITRSQVVEGTTTDACLADLKTETDGLRAKGLLDAEPLLVVTAKGLVLRGTATTDSSGRRGHVEATDGNLTCSGNYNAADQPAQKKLSIPFRCTDGRTGVGELAWSFLGQGEGVIQMSDGETALFAFGCSTHRGDVRTCPVVQAAQSTASAAPEDVAPIGPDMTTCVTHSQVIEGATREACMSARRAESDRIHAEGLADSEPVLVVSANGQILRGTVSASLIGGRGRVEATDGKLTCAGDYNSDVAPSAALAIPIRCTDGRTGVARRTFIAVSTNVDQGLGVVLNRGRGVIRMSDGEDASFAFGCSTHVGEVLTCPIVQAGPQTVPPQHPPPPQR
jgi:hypothetical protein